MPVSTTPGVSKHAMQKWIAQCDPEVTVLSLLIAQAQVVREDGDTYPRGRVHAIYRDRPDALFDLARLPPRLRKAWRNADWEAVGAYLGLGIDEEVPTTRGWPT